jgi:uncharacterized protein
MSTDSKQFLSATWKYLALLNYEVDPAVLQKHLPPFIEIDYWQGKAIVSVVGFLFHDTRVLGVKWPGHTHFEEVNLRYYIRHYDGEKWRRGVGFVSEIVPRPLVARLANTFYNEKYSCAIMSHDIRLEEASITAEYRWQKKKQGINSLYVKAAPSLQHIAEGSAEEFILEHYYGYNRLNEHATIEYSVHHPQWQVYTVDDYRLRCDVEKLYGSEFLPFITERYLQSVCFTPGSDVWVGMPRVVKQQKS